MFGNRIKRMQIGGETDPLQQQQMGSAYEQDYTNEMLSPVSELPDSNYGMEMPEYEPLSFPEYDQNDQITPVPAPATLANDGRPFPKSVTPAEHYPATLAYDDSEIQKARIAQMYSSLGQPFQSAPFNPFSGYRSSFNPFNRFGQYNPPSFQGFSSLPFGGGYSPPPMNRFGSGYSPFSGYRPQAFLQPFSGGYQAPRPPQQTTSPIMPPQMNQNIFQQYQPIAEQLRQRQETFNTDNADLLSRLRDLQSQMYSSPYRAGSYEPQQQVPLFQRGFI